LDIASKKIGFALTGSFCTFDDTLVHIERLVALGVDVTPIFSYHVDGLETRFVSGDALREKVRALTGKEIITTIPQAEPIGPKGLLDAIIIAPATGNTIAKLANGITDTPVLMAAKAVLRNARPVIVAVSTNDGLGANAKNIGALINTKNIFFVPFGQDGFKSKPTSLLAKLGLIPETLELALEGKQLHPLLLGAGEL
jgi:dipicolinate synthase subunit B